MKNPLDVINAIYGDFEVPYPKLSGALTVEVIRQRLKRNGIPVSNRDVFINRLGMEIDLIIPKPGASPIYNLIYDPHDVVAALEIKYRGAVGIQTLETTRANFKRIKQVSRRIECIYIAAVETRSYKHAVRRTNLGFPAFTLNWYANQTTEESDDWHKLIAYLDRAIQRSFRFRVL